MPYPLETTARRAPLEGTGLGLRWDFLDDVLAAIDEGRALPHVAFFEISPENYMRRGGYFPSALARIGERWPLLTHGLTMSLGGLDPLGDAYLRELGRFLAGTGTPFHSDHLCFSGAGGRVLHDLLPLVPSRAAAKHAAARIREAAERLERPIAVENITHYAIPGSTMGAALGQADLRPQTPGSPMGAGLDEAEFLAEVVDRAGCRLLLDVNNVYVNAQNYGFDPVAFLARLPLDRVAQLHVAGHTWSADDGVILDTHGAQAASPVLDLVAWVIERTGPLPVVLERDHQVPPLDRLLAELGEVEAAYQRGLAARQARGGEAKVAARAAPTIIGASAMDDGEDRASVAAAIASVAEVVRAPEAALAGAEAGRIRIYRKLVRGGLERAIRAEIPRTAARLGGAFAASVARFIDEEAPRSHYLRDVAFELVAWAAPRWAEDPAIPAYLGDLARHELSAFEVAGAPEPEAPPERADVELDRAVLFHPAARLHRYTFAIHRLDADEGARDVPERAPTALFAYRDAEHEVRWLELTQLAAAIVERLLEGATLRDAVVGGCQAEGHPLDGAVLASTAALLTDLGDRGAMWGGAR